ncbi:unnamed protein product (macronuclear) [Paramecium tetraurelia]|uniref:ubiquitinyl hydrolase 1 n=1 Tax=Paramecium tetraurelia TaxID=5888 RepID=A0BVW2_PARTE|nr:uncharacterized protein GSPATT00032531001 [Paramecium tetraurelia]CAK62679.1 unnamed protein product [Paramecium tetraurelia]|eukprot:XP_001430077.1 hypothetical protein (macronuclear) [Paramecium tetraurelia strain d4-2]
MSSILFTPEQQGKIQQVSEFSNQTKEKVIQVLIGNNWQVEKAIDFLTNAGGYISDPNPNQNVKPIVNYSQNPGQNNINPLQSKKSSNPYQGDKQNSKLKIEKSDIQKIEEQLSLIQDQVKDTSEIIQVKNQMLQKSLNKNVDHALRRIYQYPVGLANVGEKGYFNCIIQILVQNPAFLEKVLAWQTGLKPNNHEDKNISFMQEFQTIVRMLTFTNQRFLNPSKFIQQTTEVIDIITQTKISNRNLKPHEFFEIFIITLDVILCNKVYEIKQQKKLLDLILQPQFQIIQQQQQQLQVNEIILNFVREDRYLYISLLKLVCQDQFNRFSKLPKTFSFSLQSNQNTNLQASINQSNVDYWLPLTINLEFLTNEKLCKQLGSRLLSVVNAQTIEEINQKQILLNSLIIVEQSYEQNKIIPINVIDQLRIERKKVQSELQKYFLQNDSQIQTEQNQDYQYYLHAVVIQIGKDDKSHYYAYIYNFMLNQWYRYNDTDVRVESDEVVRKDAQQNGCFFVYVSQDQKRSITDHQDRQSKISNNLDQEQGIINWNDLELNKLIKPQIPKEIKKLIYSQNEGFRILDQ